jgi:RND superfamily putative drug exporter
VALLALNALSVASALGQAVVVFQDLGGEPGLTFYVAFVAAVLLLALGADYNVFAVGGSGRRPPVIRCAEPSPSPCRPPTGRSARPGSSSPRLRDGGDLSLGASRQLAFIMAVGLLLDTFLVRPVLTPAVLTLLGRSANWPAAGSAPPSGPARCRTWRRRAKRPGT